MSTHRGMLPREGFHADVLGQILNQTLLNPLITLPLLLFAKYHETGQTLAAKHLDARSLTLTTVLAVWGVAKTLNSWLDRRALNNGVQDRYDWSREVVLITGGADGIGKSMALMFAARNIRVAVLDVQPLSYEAPPSLIYIRTDITSASALAAAHVEIATRFQAKPSIVILNAGVCRGKSILDGSASDVQLTFNVNAISHYTLMREFLPALVRDNHGMVVTVASSAAWVTAPGMTDYAASKAAAMAFHEGLTAELVTHYQAPRVRTVIVNQGYTKTALFEGFGVKPGFVAPPMEVETVAEGVVRQVLKGQSGQVILPGVYKLMGAHWRSLPNWMQHGARLGLVGMMKEWKGRQVEGIEGVVKQGQGTSS